MIPSDLTASIPPFNAQKLLAAAGADGLAVEEPGAEPDAEVTFVTRDLAAVLPRAKITAILAADDILARVRDTAHWTCGAQQARYQVAGVQQLSTTLAYASADRDSDPYAGFEARIVPENITLLPKTASQVTGGNAWNERAVTVKKSENIVSILQ